MTYAELSAAILQYSENFETGFMDSVDLFIKLAEKRIYNDANIPAAQRNETATVTASNRYLTTPSGFISVNEVQLTLPSGRVTSLLNKEVSFMREAYPDPTEEAVPVFYAQFDEDTLLLAPTPDQNYPVELHFFGYPESIVTTNTTWLGDNYDQVLLYGALLEAGINMKLTKDEMVTYQEMYQQSLAPLIRQVGERNNTDNYRTGRKG